MIKGVGNLKIDLFRVDKIPCFLSLVRNSGKKAGLLH